MSRCLICFILLLVLFAGCSGQDESILTKPVQKDPGALEILNPTSFMGATVSGNIIDHVLTIKASGGLALRNINVSITTSDPISFKGGTYPGTGGTCDETLSSGETCTIIIRYEPTNTNSHMANLKFTYQDALKSYEKIYQVSADSFPILTFGYGTIYDFSNKFVGTTTDLRIRIENSGRARADNISINNLSPPFSIKGGTYPGQGGTCGNNLLPGQTCDIFVTYAPTNNGQHLQDVILTYTNTGRTESNTLRMMAWGFYQAQLTVSDSSGYDFGTVANGKTLDKTFTITYSSGDVNATSINLINLNSPFSFKGGTFPGTGGDCTTILSKERGSCRVVVSLLSQQSGTWNNNIGFKYFNGTDEITVNRSLTASTRQKAEIAFSPLGTTPFGTLELESSQSKLFTVTYTGGEMTATNLGFSGLSGFYNYTGGTYPGTGGSCGANLIAGSCTISLTYRPTSNGNHLLNPSFVYHDGADAKSIPITLAGTTPSRLSYGPTSFGNIVTEQVATLALTITSSGGTGISGLTFSTIGSPFSVTSSTCTSSLAANANCRLNLAFNPLTSGPHETNLQVTYHTGTRVVTDELTLSGNATPAAHITIPDVDFGSTTLDTPKEMEVTITNISIIQPVSPTWTLPNGFNFKGGVFPGTGGNCWSSSCKVVLIFSPTTATSYSGTLSLQYGDGAGNIKTETALLTGNVIPTNDLYLSDSNPVDFTSVYIGNVYDRSLRLFHGGGTTAAVIVDKFVENSTDYTLLSHNCPGSLNNGASCMLTVRFEPKSSGIISSSLKVNYDNGASKTATRLIRGTGATPALLTPNQASLDFGTNPTDFSYELVVTVNHSGTANAESFIRLVTGTGFTKGSDSCSTSFGGNRSCEIRIRFTPTSAISYSGNLALSYNNGVQSVTINIPLTGTGSPTSTLTFSASTYDFGDIIQTQTSTQTLTVNHSGPVPASSLSTSLLSDPYKFKGGAFPGTGGTCTDTLASGSCTLVVDFTPTSIGIKNQRLYLTYNNGTNSRTIDTLLTGESLAQAIINISEANPYHFGTTNPPGGFIDKGFTLSNGGSVPGTSLGGVFDSAAFSFKNGTFPGTGGTCTSTLGPGATCTIVLTFKPLSSVNYSGQFTLNYNDGLRIQSELKRITGLGAQALYAERMMDLLSERPTFYHQQMAAQKFTLWGESSYEQLEILDENGDLLFSGPNYLFPLVEGKNMNRLDSDYNYDGVTDLLLSIHKDDSGLVGYSIRCGKTGDVLERYLSDAAVSN